MQSSNDTNGDGPKPKKAPAPNWGPMEPVRPIFEPVVDIVKPLFTGNVVYGVLVGLLVATWFGFGFNPAGRRSPSGFGSEMSRWGPDRIAAYEEMWRREDTELWDWLEERVGLDRLNVDKAIHRKKAMQPRTAEQKIKEANVEDREIEEAIRVTEEKLKVLKEVVGKKSPLPSGGSATD